MKNNTSLAASAVTLKLVNVAPAAVALWLPEKMFVPVDYAMKGYIFRLLILDTTESIAIFSDGVQDVQKDEKERIPVEKVVHEMMSFKNYTGEFVKRRVSAALKTFAKDNIHPGDDFSMAVVHFDQEEKEVTNE